MRITEAVKRYSHEKLLICNDESSGLTAFIAIHDTTLGPACGGVRIWPYEREEDAITDVLRLSRAMTYKSAAAGLSLGGGKGLIMADSHTEKNDRLLRAFGRCVESLGGRYVTTEDVGMKPEDLIVIAEETRHVVGLPTSHGGSGDTSPLTGLGVYMGMKAAAKSVWGSDSLEGRTVAMQGFGNVGTQTAHYLVKEGAKLIVADIYQQSRDKALSIGASVVAPDDIYDVDCDIFSPCALGGTLNDETIPRLRSSIVAGGANNQLLEEKHGEALRKRGILYAPDYIINAGGIIQVACEIEGICDPRKSREMTERIFDTTERVIKMSIDEDLPTSAAADRLAQRRLDAARRQKSAVAAD